MKTWILWLILAVAFILEGTITTLPLVLISLLILIVFLNTKIILYLALILGVLLDVFLLRPVGLTSLMLIIFLFIVTLYEAKFEASTNYFVFFTSFLGSLIYLLVLDVQNPIIQAVFASLISLIAFKLLIRSEIKKRKYKIEK